MFIKSVHQKSSSEMFIRNAHQKCSSVKFLLQESVGKKNVWEFHYNSVLMVENLELLFHSNLDLFLYKVLLPAVHTELEQKFSNIVKYSSKDCNPNSSNMQISGKCFPEINDIYGVVVITNTPVKEGLGGTSNIVSDPITHNITLITYKMFDQFFVFKYLSLKYPFRGFHKYSSGSIKSSRLSFVEKPEGQDFIFKQTIFNNHHLYYTMINRKVFWVKGPTGFSAPLLNISQCIPGSPNIN
ncbi:hypothetical protein Avbf_16976 [Armadillidium vulgare]|nr:hypothetical protein Avbf_16976 [Armadillidium vulgare]